MSGENKILHKVLPVGISIPLLLALAACDTQKDLSAEQAWQATINAKQPQINLLGAAPPGITNKTTLSTIPVGYEISDPDAIVTVDVDGETPWILPRFEGGKTALVNIATEGAHTLEISAKHCESTPEFAYYCSPEALYRATIISDFTSPGTSIESISTLTDGRMQVTYTLQDANVQFGGTITNTGVTVPFDQQGKASLIFDLKNTNPNQVTVQICDAVANCSSGISFTETLQDATPPKLTLLNEKVVGGDRILTFQIEDNWQELLQYGGSVSAGGQKIPVTDRSGMVIVNQGKVNVGDAIVSASGTDFVGNTTTSENKFTYNPFPTSVEMVKTEKNGTVTFRVHVDTTSQNFNQKSVGIVTTQETDSAFINKFPLLKNIYCADPIVDSQTIDVTCTPTIPFGLFTYTLTGEAAGGQTWTSSETFTLNIPPESSGTQILYVLMTGLAYAGVAAGVGFVGTQTQRKTADIMRGRRAEEFKQTVIAKKKKLKDFLLVHDKPTTIHKVLHKAGQMIGNKGGDEIHRLSRSERAVYRELERIWHDGSYVNNIDTAITKTLAIDTFGYSSLHKLKYDMATMLFGQVVSEFEEISQNKNSEVAGSHKVKQLRDLIKGVSQQKHFKSLGKEVRERALQLTNEFDLILTAKSMSGRDFIAHKELNGILTSSEEVKDMYSTLIAWGNFTVAHEIRKLKKISKYRKSMDDEFNSGIQGVRSEFLSNLRSLDGGDMKTSSGIKKILSKYSEGMRLPHNLIQEFAFFLNLEQAHRAHDYPLMFSYLNRLVLIDNMLPTDVIFNELIEDALNQINQDLKPVFESKSVARISPTMASKFLAIETQLDLLKKTRWWDSIQCPSKYIVELQTRDLSTILLASTPGALQNKFSEIFKYKDEAKIFELIKVISQWKNFSGAAGLLASITENNDILGHSLSRSFDSQIWSVYMSTIIDNLKAGNMDAVKEIYENTVFNVTQGVEVKSLITNYMKYTDWKRDSLPHWAHTDLFPFPEETLAMIDEQVQRLVLENRLTLTQSLRVVEKWYEFVSLNAKPTALFTFVDIPVEEIQQNIRLKDILPLAKQLKMKLAKITAKLDSINSTNREVDKELIEYYRLIGTDLQMYWLAPLLGWMKEASKIEEGKAIVDGKVKIIQKASIPTTSIVKKEFVESQKEEQNAIIAINNLFFALLQLGAQRATREGLLAGVRPLDRFIGDY